MERILWALILFWNVENYFAPFDFSESYSRNASQTAGLIPEHSKNLDYTVLIDNRNAKEFPTSENTSEQSRKFRNWKSFSHKRDGIAKTLCLVAGMYGRFPDIVGLGEVENRWVLKQLTQNTVLAGQDYGIVHKDSPDARGIDVALLYRRSTFRPISVQFIPITIASSPNPSDTISSQKQVSHTEKAIELHLDKEAACDSISTSKKVVKNKDTLRTREILYVKGVLRGYDTLHVFVNHWPSKLGGKAAQSHRCGIARKLRWLCDSIAASVEGGSRSCIEAKAEDSLEVEHSDRWDGNRKQVKVWHGAKIVIMGDFNASAGDAALEILEGADVLENDNSIENSGENRSENRRNSSRFGYVAASPLLVNVNEEHHKVSEAVYEQEGNDMKRNDRMLWKEQVHGSYKYKGEWSTIDRFYVSRYFIEGKEISAGQAEIFSHPFLLEADRTYLGVKPRRSFVGPRFNGGLSDHLPLILRIFSLHFL